MQKVWNFYEFIANQTFSAGCAKTKAMNEYLFLGLERLSDRPSWTMTS